MAWDAPILISFKNFDPFTIFARTRTVIDAELGKKLVCPSCSVKFYDLGNDPAECPKCDTIFSAEPILPSKEDRPPSAEVKAEAIEEDKTASKKDDDEVEVVSLEDLDEDDDIDAEDDELAAVKDVDLGDGDKDEESTGEDDDSFLEIDDGESSNVSDIVGVGSNDDES